MENEREILRNIGTILIKINILLIIAVLLDPTYKLGYVKFWCLQFYDKKNLDNIRVKGVRPVNFQKYKEFDMSSVVLENLTPPTDTQVSKNEDCVDIFKKAYHNILRTDLNQVV